MHMFLCEKNVGETGILQVTSFGVKEIRDQRDNVSKGSDSNDMLFDPILFLPKLRVFKSGCKGAFWHDGHAMTETLNWNLSRSDPFSIYGQTQCPGVSTCSFNPSALMTFRIVEKLGLPSPDKAL